MRHNAPPFDDEQPDIRREIFPGEDGRLYARPEIRVPSRGVALASVVVAIGFALALILSHRRTVSVPKILPPADTATRGRTTPTR